MILLLISIILTIVMVCIYNWNLRRIQMNIENFETQTTGLIPEQDRKMYFFIIDTYGSLLKRYPTSTELNDGFGNLTSTNMSKQNFIEHIMSSTEYKNMNKDRSASIQLEKKLEEVMEIIAPDSSILTPMSKQALLAKYVQLGQNFDEFQNYIKGTVEYKNYSETKNYKPSSNNTDESDKEQNATTSSETTEPQNRTITMTAYEQQLNVLNDILRRPDINENRSISISETEEALIDESVNQTTRVTEEGEVYTTPSELEQQQRTSTTINRNASRVNEEGEVYTTSQYNNEEDTSHPILDSIHDDNVVVIVDGKRYNLPRPDINKHTQLTDGKHTNTKKTKKTKKLDCSALDKISENTSLAELHSKREMEDLKYHCEMRNNYDNVNDDLTLIKGQEWSVPQQRTPVCYSQSCHVANQFDQTSLIGTLIGDVEENRYIMPEFTYAEDM